MGATGPTGRWEQQEQPDQPGLMGPTGSTGPTGPTGPNRSDRRLSGGFVRLQQRDYCYWCWRRRAIQPGTLIVGTAIGKNNNTTFMVNANGTYRITYTLRTALVSLLANVQVRVNGVGVGPTAALVLAGTSVSIR